MSHLIAKPTLAMLVSVMCGSMLAGCASFSSDKKGDEFSCSGLPDGAVCMDPIEVYERTNAGASVSASPAGAAGGASASGKPGTDVPVVVQRNLVVQPSNPKPILEEAQVMRVWVAPFVDANQDLQWPGHIFTEVTPRRWSFGERDVENIRTAVPLQVSAQDPRSQNVPLPVSAQPDYVPGMPPNPAGAIPAGPTHMRQNDPELDRRPYANDPEFMNYN